MESTLKPSHAIGGVTTIWLFGWSFWVFGSDLYRLTLKLEVLKRRRDSEARKRSPSDMAQSATAKGRAVPLPVRVQPE